MEHGLSATSACQVYAQQQGGFSLAELHEYRAVKYEAANLLSVFGSIHIHHLVLGFAKSASSYSDTQLGMCLPAGASTTDIQALPRASVLLGNAVDSATSIDNEQQMLSRSLPTVPLAAPSLPKSDDALTEQAFAAERQLQASPLAQPAGHRPPVNVQHQDEGDSLEADRQNTHSNQSVSVTSSKRHGAGRCESVWIRR